MKSKWDEVADWWDKQAGESGIWHQRHDIDPVVRNVLGSVKGKKILEIGCGNGYFSRALAKKGAIVTATDISAKFIQLARAKQMSQASKIRYCQRDAAHLTGFKPGSFHLVVANMMLMDIAKYHNAINEVSRVLKHRGRFVFSIVHPLYSDWQHGVIRYHGRQYYARLLKKYLSETSTDRMIWGNGSSTPHYHRPLQSYMHALRNTGFALTDLHEIKTGKPVVKTPSSEKKISNKLTRYYFNKRDRDMKVAARREIPLFLVVEAT